MFKKLMCTLLVIAIISVFGLTAFAAPADIPSVTPEAGIQKEADPNDILSTEVRDILKKATGVTKRLLVTIIRPDQETDSTYKSTYVISGVTDFVDVRVVLEVYNEESNEYVLMKNTDGESFWNIGRFGVFSKEIKLKEGMNRFRILAYMTSQESTLKEEDVQVKKFTVTLLKASIKDKIIQTFINFTNFFIK